MLSRRYYTMIANRAKQAREEHADHKVEVLDEFLENLAIDFAKDNPTFDRDRFMTACGRINLGA